MALPLFSNPAARRLFLHRHALTEVSGPGRGDDLAGLIDRIGFVQVDSINTVARAHQMILFARRPAYRPPALDRLLAQRRLWEHWTHDASILPVETFPHWRHRFRRHAETRADRWRAWLGSDDHERQFDIILNRIARDGPVGTADVGEGEVRSKGGWWDWHPSKAALEWLWHTGQIAVTRREGFRKIFDLTERVIPPALQAQTVDTAQTVDWACGAALDRLGFATPGELAAYWTLVTPDEAKAWVAAALARGDVAEVEVQGADGSLRRHVMRPGTWDAEVPDPPARLRVLSPFDPALRDRARAERLFGFRYRIEVFVPEPRRQFGYYVFPLLEGARLVGRIDMKRTAGRLTVRRLWAEDGITWGTGRLARLTAELDRLARWAGCAGVDWAAGARG